MQQRAAHNLPNTLSNSGANFVVVVAQGHISLCRDL
jgi:hypothetical protein